MTISMYQASVPVFARGLASLKTILTKGAAHAAAKKIDETVFLTARLYPDMLPFARQFISPATSRAALWRGSPAANRRSGRTTRRPSPS